MDPYSDAYGEEPPKPPTKDEVVGLFWRGLYFVVVVTALIGIAAEAARYFGNN